MSGRPTYSVGALRRIAALGDKSIAGFFNEIPRDRLTSVASMLPGVPGFRPGTNGAVQRQLQSLVQKIAARRMPKELARSREETALYGFWRAWSQSQFKIDAVGPLFNGFDEDDQGEETGIGENKFERMAAGVKTLVASGTCAREALERFVTFSPFADIDALLELVREARTSAEIRRDSTLLELPDRLHNDETRLQRLETKLDASERDTSSIRSDLNEVRRMLPELKNKAAEDRAAIEELKRSTGATVKIERTLNDAIVRFTGTLDRLAARITAAERQISAMAEEHAVLRTAFAQITENQRHLSAQMASYEAGTAELAAAVRSSEAHVESLNERLVALQEFGRRIDRLEALLSQTVDTERHVAPQADHPITVEPSISAAPVPTILVERIKLEPGLPVKPLHPLPDILASLDGALMDAGLKKSTAAIFAEEILAAIASEQVVFFRGGFSVDVARKCALSVCGTSVFRVAIPLGLNDPSLLRQQLASRSGAERSLSAVVIEAVNNSPLDLLRDILLDLVTSRVGGSGHQMPTIAFANLVEGAGAFPLEPSYLELGPVFDLEQMDWRRLRREGPPVLGSIAGDDWRSIAARWDGQPANYEEALQGARRFATKRNARFEANIVRSFAAVEAIRRKQHLTALQSITFGWLAPYWQSLGTKAEDIDAQIDGGKCDGNLADERLKCFIATPRSQWSGAQA